MSSHRWQAWLLVLGCAVGAGLAAFGILQPRAGIEGDDWVAVVNGERISRSSYMDHLRLLSDDKRSPMTDGDRRFVLERMLEEILLIERGLEIGLPYSDTGVRKAIIDALLDNQLANLASTPPNEAELLQFYRQNLEYFSGPSLRRVRRMVFRGEAARERSESAYARLASEKWDTVAGELAEREVASLPGSPLPLARLRDYLGPSQAKRVLDQAVGEYSRPIPDPEGYTILQTLEIEPASTRQFADIRDEVAREFQRRSADEAIRTYLDALRSGADIRINHELLEKLDDRAPDGD